MTPAIIVVVAAWRYPRSGYCYYTLQVVNWVIRVYKWYLPTLSEIITLTEPDPHHSSGFPAQQRIRAEREWSGAVMALNSLLQQQITVEKRIQTDRAVDVSTAPKGVLLSGPFPILSQLDLVEYVASWVFTIASPGEILQLLPAVNSEHAPHHSSRYSTVPTLPLLPSDPLAAEQFCLALTPEFSLVMVLGETAEGDPAFLFSFNPDVVQQTLRALEARIKLSAPQLLQPLMRTVEQFPLVQPNYQIVTQFSRLLLANLPQPLELDGSSATYPNNRVFTEAGKSLVAASARSTTSPSNASQRVIQPIRQEVHRGGKAIAPTLAPEQEHDPVEAQEATGSDTELLQAIAHEVRTPLTTIRTLTRLLMRRKDLNPDVYKRLEVIDRECTEQIDRFNLIFRAVELETTPSRSALASLAPIPLDHVIQQNVARWQQQASQHSHTLEVILPQKMPLVVTDPTMLDQVLTGLIDRITHSLPPGGHIQVKVSLAGHQLKLQLESQPQADSAETTSDEKGKFGFAPALKSIGQLLMFQPETGNLSLNMAVTKNLFQALGGKLIVRQHPHQREVLTIFLPLDTKKDG